jgi:hypothetical protein
VAAVSILTTKLQHQLVGSARFRRLAIRSGGMCRLARHARRSDHARRRHRFHVKRHLPKLLELHRPLVLQRLWERRRVAKLVRLLPRAELVKARDWMLARNQPRRRHARGSSSARPRH